MLTYRKNKLARYKKTTCPLLKKTYLPVIKKYLPVIKKILARYKKNTCPLRNQSKYPIHVSHISTGISFVYSFVGTPAQKTTLQQTGSPNSDFGFKLSIQRHFRFTSIERNSCDGNIGLCSDKSSTFHCKTFCVAFMFITLST